MAIFAQVWLWSALAFVAGSLLTWVLLANPARKRAAELENRLASASAARQRATAAERANADRDRYEDEEFDDRPYAAQPSVDQHDHRDERPLAEELFGGGSGGYGETEHLPIDAEGRGAAQPTKQVPAVGSLEAPQQSHDLFAPPEPAIDHGNGDRGEDAAQTQYIRPVVEAPAEVDESDRGWFDRTDGGQDEQNLVDDLDDGVPAEQQANLVEDVEDVDDVDETGTIFTQHTTPIPAVMIEDLDRREQDGAVPEAGGIAAALDEQPAQDQEPEPEPVPAGPPPLPKRVKSGTRSPDFGQRIDERRQDDDPPARSLFEPIVPVEEMPTTAVRPPQRDDEPQAGQTGLFVPPGPFGPGSAMPLPGGGSPSPDFQIKASVTALRYCGPESPQFGRTVAEVWFRTPDDAERVGFRPIG